MMMTQCELNRGHTRRHEAPPVSWTLAWQTAVAVTCSYLTIPTHNAHKTTHAFSQNAARS